MSGEAGLFNLEVVTDASAMSRRAADIVAEEVTRNPRLVFAMPTGSTPVAMFADLVRRVEAGSLDFGQAELVCLDEYVGLPEGDPNRLTVWLRRTFADPAGLAPDRMHVIPADAADPRLAAGMFERDFATRGGLDLVVLGIGPNGHIAYNDPPADADSRTRIVDLTPESVAAAAKGWHPTCPVSTRAMTLGVGTLLEARRIVLIATGAAKAEIVRRALTEPMTPEVPASWLRRAGDRLTVVVDEAAASGLSGSV